ncbi:DNA-directed DNA polymerase gamma mip1, partial [Rhizophlyctis rosea]
MLPPKLHSNVFPQTTNHKPPTDAQKRLARQHLETFDLYGKTQDPMPDIDLELPHLTGRDIKEHFRVLGLEQSEPFWSMANKFAEAEIPEMPKEWVLKEGWHRYDKNGKGTPVDYPDADALVLDTEVLYKISHCPIMAVAVSPHHWYSWLSPGIWSHNLNTLINLGNPDTERIIIGHHVAYDRARILEEYRFKPTKYAFIDTMSLHSAVGGLSSQQRPTWRVMQRERQAWESRLEEKRLTGDMDVEKMLSADKNRPKHWCDVSTMSSLKAASKLYLGQDIDKTRREEFFSGTDVSIFRDDTVLRNALSYCAEDVRTTFHLFQIIFPQYLEKCPHPASFAGMLHMGKGYLPVTQQWQKYLETADEKFNQVYEAIETFLLQRANEVLTTVGKEEALKDPWLKHLDWSTSAPNPKDYDDAIEDRKNDLTSRPSKHLPKWYKSLWDTKLKRMRLTSTMRIAPYLLKLQWKGYPLYHMKQFGWTYYIPKHNIPTEILSPPLQFSTDPTSAKTYDPIASTDTTHTYFRLPHPEGDTKNCGNPLAKSFMPAMENGELTSRYEEVTGILRDTTQGTYWRGVRDRVQHQFVVTDQMTINGPPGQDGGKIGVILPQSIVMGTVTRRAVEPTWMTAANAKKNKIGSELKSLIKAPEGYNFVGADVDSEELWIASLLGDALFGMHGSTAIGFMTLQGSKSNGTDLHTSTGKILGIGRGNAKVFNYSRIYGAGMKHAIQLLLNFNPEMGRVEAERRAFALYARTKGSSAPSGTIGEVRSGRRSGTRIFEKFWFGGSESLMFNEMERIAKCEDPRTPVLGCGIPNSLMPKYVKDEYMTSRINWVVQSSGVDYLHLLLVSANYLFRRMQIDGRFLLSIHDEVRYMVKEEHKYLASYALQVANLWVRAAFARSVGLNDLPMNVAFFSAIDIDHCLRKEVDLDCVTPSNPTPIPPGEAIDIYALLPKLGEYQRTHRKSSILGPELASVQKMAKVLREMDVQKDEVAGREGK